MYKKLPKYNNLYINTEDWQLYRIVDGQMQLVESIHLHPKQM